MPCLWLDHLGYDTMYGLSIWAMIPCMACPSGPLYHVDGLPIWAIVPCLWLIRLGHCTMLMAYPSGPLYHVYGLLIWAILPCLWLTHLNVNPFNPLSLYYKENINFERITVP